MLKLPPWKLVTVAIANAIDSCQTGGQCIQHCSSHRDASQQIKSFQKTKHMSEVKISQMFSADFEDMSCIAAISVAGSHGIQIDTHLHKDEVKDLIVEHLVHG